VFFFIYFDLEYHYRKHITVSASAIGNKLK